MNEYTPPLRDMRFLLEEVWDAPALWKSIPQFSEINMELAEAMLEEIGKLAAQTIAPLRAPADAEGVHLEGMEVRTPSGYREAYKAFVEGGWGGIVGNPEYGGQGMSYMFSVPMNEMLTAADISFSLYPGLTEGLTLALEKHGTEAQKREYLPKLYSGEWSGAMCLTEAHAGSDLGLIRTRAVPCEGEEGRYKISGTKIFITSGEHDLSENIAYLTLARLPDAPAGSKGISMFLISKLLPDSEGTAQKRNGVQCLSLEKKMGLHASATCVLQFDNAIGTLVGLENRGLAAMFTMMNYERLMVGLQGIGCSAAAYQKALDYAKERTQGRSPESDKSSDQADPLIVHADVRRMLLTQKAFIEGARALAFYVGMKMDLQRYGEQQQSSEAGMIVDLLTPIVKAFFTDKGLESCVLAQQVLGGHGYVRDTGIEQLVRDVRITQIYEGTNGIQAMDLASRKVAMNGGRLVEYFVAEIRKFCDSVRDVPGMKDYLAALERALSFLEQDTRRLLENSGKAHQIGAVAVSYLHLFGYVALAWVWAQMAHIALSRKDGDDTGFYQAKLHTADFYMHHMLPQIEALSRSMQNGAKGLMELPAADF